MTNENTICRNVALILWIFVLLHSSDIRATIRCLRGGVGGRREREKERAVGSRRMHLAPYPSFL